MLESVALILVKEHVDDFKGPKKLKIFSHHGISSECSPKPALILSLYTKEINQALHHNNSVDNEREGSCIASYVSFLYFI